MNAVEQAIKTISDAIAYPKSPNVREAFKTLRAAHSIETPHEDNKEACAPAVDVTSYEKVIKTQQAEIEALNAKIEELSKTDV